MQADDPDQLFLAWRRTGDPRALAQVFDRLAPELLLVAAHLTGRSQVLGLEAEDLLQATFLAAIQSAHAFDAAWPLRPWLIGILANLVRREQRRMAVAQAHAPWRDRVQDPLADVAAAEFAERFAATLTALPQPYRTVLTLRLVHGLKAIEIAHALGQPPATVRTHVHRGLALMRDALPAGFAVSTLLVFGGGRSLAAVRATVLERLVPPPPGTEPASPMVEAGTQALAPAATAGRRLPGLWGALAAATMAVTVTVVALVSGERPGTTRGPALAGVEAPEGPGSRPAAQPVIARTPTVAAGPDATDTRSASARIQVRWADDGTPAAGVQVSLVFPRLPDPSLHERWVVTDQAGVVTVAGLPAADCELGLDRGGERTHASLAAGACHNIDLVVPAGVMVVGKVVGPEDAPVAGAAVALSGVSSPDQGLVVARTDADGLFRLRAVTPGTFLSATADGFLPAHLRPIAAQPGETVKLKLRLEAGGIEVTGRIVDAEHRPVANALILLGNNLGAVRAPVLHHDIGRRPPIWLVTDADGAFRTASAWSIFPTFVNAWVRAPGFATWALSLPLASGRATRVEITLRRGAVLAGVVRDAGGQPVPDALVVIADDQIAPLGVRAQAPPWAYSTARTGADGRYRLPNVRDRALRLRAEDDAGRHAVARLDADDGETHTWDPVLLPPGHITGYVVDQDGVPLPGWHVEAHAGAFESRAQTGATDARGAFDLAPCDRAAHVVRAFEPGSVWGQPALSLAAVEPGGGPLAMSIPHARRATVSLRGRIVEPDGRPATIDLAVDGDRIGGAMARTDPASGAFEVGPLPPGTLRLRHYEGLQNRATLAVATVAPGSEHDVGTITLQRPGTVRLRVRRADGVPVTGGEARLSAPDGTLFVILKLTSAETTSPAVGPGTYFLRVLDTQMPAHTTVQVRSGEETSVDLLVPESVEHTLHLVPPPHVWACQVVLEWLDGADHVLTRERISLSSSARPVPVRLPRGTWRVRARDEDGRQAQAGIEVTDLTASPIPIRLVLQ